MLSCILFIPFCIFIFCTFLGGSKFLGKKGLIIIIPIFLSPLFFFCLNLFIFFFFNHNILKINYNFWFDVDMSYIEWGIILDNSTLIMCLLVISVSIMVHIFSLSYMEGEPHLSRFIGYLSLFTFFMLVLILSNNLIQIFIGWEGVGICSYLLINFWSGRILASQSAFKAMLINKIGDISFLLGLSYIYKITGTFQIIFINFYFSFSSNFIITFLFLLAVIGKSAQVGLHMWLPDAMEGPTPVSALIHAATMVTAGVFLIIKLSPIFENHSINLLLMVLGSITCFIAASISSNQNDLKKVIAYSTCSQLGYMVLVCGYGYYKISLFHLFNHGIFKALLFLSAGLVIHTLNNEQSVLKMGLKKSSIIGKYSILCGSLAIIGFPFFTGYYSKDLFLELLALNNFMIFPLWLGYIAASLTCFYSLKTFYKSYYSYFSYNFNTYLNNNNSFFLIIPLFILGLGSIYLGYTFNNIICEPLFIPIVNNFTKILPLILISIITYLLFRLIPNYNFFFFSVKNFLTKTWLFNEIANKIIIKISFNYFKMIYKKIDNQILEYISASGLSNIIKYNSSINNNFWLNILPFIINSLIWSIIIIFFFF